ncbi:MAG: tetratricopeptide repeat protein [Bacteroidetes bacterium]|nr:tetratricopeptide repeat protein [Bacteroidota bacterium]
MLSKTKSTLSQKLSRPSSLVSRPSSLAVDTSRVNTLNSLAWLLQHSEPGKGIDYAEQALKLATQLNFKSGIANAFHALGSIKANVGDYDKALDYFAKDLSISTELGDKQGMGTSLNSIGNIHAQRGDYDKALDFYFRSVAIKEELGDKKGLASAYGNVGNIHFLKGDNDKALEFYLKDLKLFQELGSKKGMADSYNNMGLVYAQKRDFSKALEYYFKDLEITKELGDKQGEADSYGNIGIISVEQGDFNKALVYYLKSFDIRKELGDKQGMSDSYNSIGSLYLKQNRLKDAKEYQLKSLGLAKEINAKPAMMSAYIALSVCDSAMENFKEAYQYHKLYSQIKDSVFNEESNLQMTEMQTRYETEKKQKEIELLNKEKENQEALTASESKRQKIILLFVFCGLVVSLVFAFILFRGYKQKQKINIALEEKNKIIEEKNKDITASINYARRIQTAMLVDREEIATQLNDFFILYKPKDIVSGDFYYYAEAKNKIIIGAVDCTGHGVPGAFMSMIGNDALNEIIKGKEISTPSEILRKLHDSVRTALKQDSSSKTDTKDGMDLALCALDLQTNTLEFAGAFRNLFITRSATKTMEEIKADKQSIGGEKSDEQKTFTNHTIQLNKGDAFYIFTDGYTDQFGGDHGKKFMVKRMMDLILSVQDKNMREQEMIFDCTLEEWKNKREQVDDILLIGVRV